VILDDGVGIFYSHGCKGLCEVGNGHGLEAQHVVGIEEGLEIFGGQEGPLWEGVD
jgi:hypothetical protein